MSPIILCLVIETGLLAGPDTLTFRTRSIAQCASLSHYHLLRRLEATARVVSKEEFLVTCGENGRDCPDLRHRPMN
ncbi:hypothetical protein [Methylobacterium sp. JK268]